MNWPWSELGLSGPAGLPEIRRAYAQRLKTTHPEEDPEGFQRLHAAYREASRLARRAQREAPEPESPREDGPQEPAGEERDPSGQSRQEHDEPSKGPEDPSPEAPRDWDYGELLKDREAPKKPPEKPKAPAWDYDELLKNQESPEAPRSQGQQGPEEAPREPEWDFERLFAEGEAEARQARRRKLEELREKNRARYARQEREQRRRAADEEESWAAVMAAAHALELLYGSGAPLSLWRAFLDSPVFQNVRSNIDFVFALEDFLEQHPDLSPEIRRAFFLAYESCNASKYPMYNRLYRLLNVDRRDKRRMAKGKSGWRARWRSFPLWRKACAVGALALLAVCVLILFLPNNYEPPVKEPEVPWPEQAPQWLEADYGETFVSGPSENLFAPAAEPGLYFWAVRNSKRSSHWPGYLTNYPYVRVRQALEDFAGERELVLDLARYTGNPGDAPMAYLFDLPLLGAEEDISALGKEIARLSALPWHQRSAAERRTQQGIGDVGYQVYLCHKGLAFYDAYAPKNFDAEEALSLYAQAGPAFCRYILEHGGLAEEHLGKDAYVLLDQGLATLGDKSFFLVTGADKDTGEAKAHYLLASGGSMLFCLPGGGLDRVSALTDLYQGAFSHLQLEDVGLVMVWDQVKPQSPAS